MIYYSWHTWKYIPNFFLLRKQCCITYYVNSYLLNKNINQPVLQFVLCRKVSCSTPRGKKYKHLTCWSGCSHPVGGHRSSPTNHSKPLSVSRILSYWRILLQGTPAPSPSVFFVVAARASPMLGPNATIAPPGPLIVNFNPALFTSFTRFPSRLCPITHCQPFSSPEYVITPRQL